MININGLTFVRGSRALTNTLYQPINGKTADGFYRVHRNAVRLYKPNGDLFAAIVKFSDSGSCGFVSAGTHDGKPYFMQGMCSLDEDFLRLPKSYIAECDLAESLFKQASEVKS